MTEYNAKIADSFNVTSFEQWHAPAGLSNGDVCVLLHSIGRQMREEIDKAVAPLKARLKKWKCSNIAACGRKARRMSRAILPR